jgi:hypothetical protein
MLIIFFAYAELSKRGTIDKEAGEIYYEFMLINKAIAPLNGRLFTAADRKEPDTLLKK